MIVNSLSSSGQSAAAMALQEATETLAQTKAEALKGDMQAIRKLALIEAQQVSHSNGIQASNEPGTPGSVFNALA